MSSIRALRQSQRDTDPRTASQLQVFNATAQALSSLTNTQQNQAWPSLLTSKVRSSCSNPSLLRTRTAHTLARVHTRLRSDSERILPHLRKPTTTRTHAHSSRTHWHHAKQLCPSIQCIHLFGPYHPRLHFHSVLKHSPSYG